MVSMLSRRWQHHNQSRMWSGYMWMLTEAARPSCIPKDRLDKGLTFMVQRHSGRVIAAGLYALSADCSQTNEYATMDEALADIGAAFSTSYCAIRGA
jgi:hypothetical protein